MEKKIMKNQYVIILGGLDAEMLEIKGLAKRYGIKTIDKHFTWGCNLEMVLPEVKRVIKAGKIPVCVELPNKWKDNNGIEHSVEIPSGTVMIDHHGEFCNREAAVLQVCRMFGWNISRWTQMVAANDSHYISGMRRIGTPKIKEVMIRSLDRKCQGCTPWHEEEAKRAIKNKETEGRITTVHMEHSKCSPVTDRLFGTYDILFIVSSDNEKNVFAPEEDIQTLVDAGLTAWNGPEFAGSYEPEEEILDFLRTL